MSNEGELWVGRNDLELAPLLLVCDGQPSDRSLDSGCRSGFSGGRSGGRFMTLRSDYGASCFCHCLGRRRVSRCRERSPSARGGFPPLLLPDGDRLYGLLRDNVVRRWQVIRTPEDDPASYGPRRQLVSSWNRASPANRVAVAALLRSASIADGRCNAFLIFAGQRVRSASLSGTTTI